MWINLHDDLNCFAAIHFFSISDAKKTAPKWHAQNDQTSPSCVSLGRLRFCTISCGNFVPPWTAPKQSTNDVAKNAQFSTGQFDHLTRPTHRYGNPTNFAQGPILLQDHIFPIARRPQALWPKSRAEPVLAVVAVAALPCRKDAIVFTVVTPPHRCRPHVMLMAIWQKYIEQCRIQSGNLRFDEVKHHRQTPAKALILHLDCEGVLRSASAGFPPRMSHRPGPSGLVSCVSTCHATLINAIIVWQIFVANKLILNANFCWKCDLPSLLKKCAIRIAKPCKRGSPAWRWLMFAITYGQHNAAAETSNTRNDWAVDVCLPVCGPVYRFFTKGLSTDHSLPSICLSHTTCPLQSFSFSLFFHFLFIRFCLLFLLLFIRLPIYLPVYLSISLSTNCLTLSLSHFRPTTHLSIKQSA